MKQATFMREIMRASSSFSFIRIYLVLDVVHDADDPVGVRGAPVDDGVHANGHAVAGQNLFFVSFFCGGKGRTSGIFLLDLPEQIN